MDDIRKKIVRLIYEKGESHLGSCLSCVEILQAIKEQMNDGDTFILSKAHAQRAVDAIDMPGQRKELVCYGGSLGNGFGIGVGIALAIPDRMVYVVCGDGESREGSMFEATNFLKDKKINNIRVAIDNNGLGAYSRIERDSFDGHNVEKIKDIMRVYAVASFSTVKGKGIPELENTMESHYHKITESDLEKWNAQNLG